MRGTILPGLMTLAVAACATVPEPTGPDSLFVKATEGRVAGRARSCIDLSEANGAEVFDGGIIYTAGRNVTYVNMSPGCRKFGSDDLFVNEVHGSQLCRGDRVRFVDRTSHIDGGGCVLGNFVPYRRPS